MHWPSAIRTIQPQTAPLDKAFAEAIRPRRDQEMQTMSRKHTDYEWLFAERAGEQFPTAGNLSEKGPAAPLVPNSQARKLPLGSVLALLLFLSVGGYLIWRRAEAGWNQLEVEIRTAVDADDWTIHHQPKPPLEDTGKQQDAGHSSATSKVTLHPPLGSEMLGMEVEGIRVDGRVAIVQVVVTETLSPGESITYRESRFYTHSDQGWQRSAPQPDWFGPWQTLETDSFQIRYRQLSAQMIHDAVPRLEAMAQLLRQDFGLPATTGYPKVLIEVSDVAARIEAANDMIVVPMPALLQIPAEVPLEQAFVQSAIHPLASLLLGEVEAQQSHEWRSQAENWQLMLNALALWELWASDEPVVGWRLDIVGLTPVKAEVRSASRTRHCVSYNVWGLFFTTLSSLPSCPLMAWQAQTEIVMTPMLLTIYDLVAESSFLKHMPSLSASKIRSQHYSEAQQAWKTTLAMTTVVDYAVATYGRERLPSLIAGCGLYASWDELIPAIYGVPAHEFEQGWQRYLAEKYQVQN